jgi:hypothetical protein
LQSIKFVQLDDGKYCCPVCDKMFSTSSAIVRHYRTHTGKCEFYLSGVNGISYKEFFHAVVYTPSPPPPPHSGLVAILLYSVIFCHVEQICKVLAMQQIVG